MSFILRCLFVLTSFLIVAQQLEGGKCPKFKTEATKNEREDIAYVVNTLAAHSSIGLLKYKNSLEEAGERTRQVPPFSFFGVVLTNTNTKASLKKLSSSNTIQFKKFCNGFTKEFLNEATKPCFETTFEGFCKATGLDSKKMLPLFLESCKAAKKKRGTPFAPFIREMTR
jgi:hypothetical protein